MKNNECQYQVLGPWAEAEPVSLQGISPRLTDLKDKTIGLYDSTKKAAFGILTVIEEQLREKFPTTKFSWFNAGGYWHGQPHFLEPQHQEWKERFEEWIRGVDAVILARGD